MRVNPGRIPPGGYAYEVAPGIRLTAPTMDMLYPLIAEYRARHGLPPGDPRRDVDDYICSRWPHFCRPEKNEKPAPNQPRSLAVRVAEWAASLIRSMPAGGYELVDTREAARRADICRGCPQQQSWRLKCTPCNASTESLLSTIRRMKRTGIDSSLLGCNIGGIDNATGVWLPEERMRLTDEEKGRHPQNCWRLRL